MAAAATFTEAGTLTAALLLERATDTPPVGAGLASVTVQLSVPAPVMDEFVQANPFKAGAEDAATPVPLSATVIEGSDSELFATVSWPVALPVAVGANCTLRLRVLFAAIVAGRVPAPLTVKTLPVIVRAEITTGFELVFARASLAVAGDPTVALPKATLPGVTVIVPALALGVPLAVLLAVNPPQPARERDAARTAKPNRRYESRL